MPTARNQASKPESNREPSKAGQGHNWQDQNEADAVGLFGSGVLRRTLFTGALMVYSQLILVLWYIIKELDGSTFKFYEELKVDWKSALLKGYILPGDVSTTAWQFIGAMFVVALVFMRVLPGEQQNGPVTPTGHTPVYKENGVKTFLLEIALFVYGGLYTDYYKLSIVYDEFGSIINGLNYIAIVFIVLLYSKQTQSEAVLWLYIKGIVAPSTKDCGTSGNIVFDLYWGSELYPRIFGWDVKQFSNCRFGMMFWIIATISCTAAAADRNDGEVPLTMWTTLIPQFVYVYKFFLWEVGYFNSIDIMQDRAGYYIVWGCLVYLPTVYTSMSLYMVEHSYIQDPRVAVAIIAASLLSIWANYDADKMRADFRKANGKCNIWGKPAEYITAEYTTADGKTRESLLLVSGWWGISRHSHYVFEIAAAFFWSCGSGFDNFIPFFYVAFLVCLLTDRSVRDDVRCGAKYGKHWEKYCERVPYKIVPGIF